MPTKTITCLAASIKHGGYCYAGKDASGNWVRPVSTAKGHAISARWRMVGRGDPAKVGDIIRMSVGPATPSEWQTENYRHIEQYWRRVGRAEYDDVVALADDPDAIWPAGGSSNHGTRNDMTETQAKAFDNSLLLIPVSDLVVATTDEGFNEIKYRARAWFSYKGVRYGLSVTDPSYFESDPGDADIGEAMLCCSLAEGYDHSDGTRHVSKLVAAIITPETLA